MYMRQQSLCPLPLSQHVNGRWTDGYLHVHCYNLLYVIAMWSNMIVNPHLQIEVSGLMTICHKSRSPYPSNHHSTCDAHSVSKRWQEMHSLYPQGFSTKKTGKAKSGMGGAAAWCSAHLQMACKVWHFLNWLEKHEPWEPRRPATKVFADSQATPKLFLHAMKYSCGLCAIPGI